MENSNLWRIDSSQLEGVTPNKALELIVQCFVHAQKETLMQGQQRLGLPPDIDTVTIMIKGYMMKAFGDICADYYNPKKQDLEKMVDMLSKQCASWNTPKEIIEHH